MCGSLRHGATFQSLWLAMDWASELLWVPMFPGQQEILEFPPISAGSAASTHSHPFADHRNIETSFGEAMRTRTSLSYPQGKT